MILGIYHSRHAAADDAHRLRDLETIARAGFNTVACPLNLANAKAALDTALRVGVKLLVENNDPLGIYKMAQECKGHPALLGWQVVDDADNGLKTLDQIRISCGLVKHADPQSLTYISAGSGNGRDKGAILFTGLSDALGVQEYPVPWESIDRAYTALRPIVVKAGKQPVIANLQAFDWQKTVNGIPSRPPTPQELTRMALLALGAGCKGILWYAFTDATGWNLSANLELWRACSMATKAVKTIAGTLEA